MSVLHFSKTVLKSLFGKPATLMYPVQVREYSDNTRGQIHFNGDDCILCGLCQKKCPAGAIKVSRDEQKWEINRFRCIACNYCSEVCPKKCLEMVNKYVTPRIAPDSVETFTSPYVPPSKKPAAEKGKTISA
ncbi:4Fe-4S binding protein [Bacillota bacterium LX-D]|nr:4Fe-4S binding protein [Bacillota bacterium LX-D]